MAKTPPQGQKHARKRTESPLQYFRRTRTVDDNFLRSYRGRFFCNPGHCRRSWTRAEERDAHLTDAIRRGEVAQHSIAEPSLIK